MRGDDNPYVSRDGVLPLTKLPESLFFKELYTGKRGYDHCECCLKRLTDPSSTTVDTRTGNLYCSRRCMEDRAKYIRSYFQKVFKEN